MLLALLAALMLWHRPAAQVPRELYASPAGTAGNDGSIARPLDLATALSATSPLRPGDTLWLRGGRYLGNFTSHLTGTAAAPIVVRQYPGERATLDAATANRTAPALSVRGADTWYWGFEVTDTTTQRVTANFAADPKRATSIDVTGPRTRFINLVVHDGLQGFGFWSAARDAEIYGTIIQHVGVEAPDRGHGHHIYVQNEAGWKRIVDNILLYSFSFGVHAYTSGSRVDNIHIEGNTMLGAGLLSATSGAKANVVTGGGDGADFTRALDNVSYFSSLIGRGLDLDYGTPCRSPEIRGNYVIAATPVNVTRCTAVTMTGNTFYGATGALASQFPANVYHATRPTGVRTFVRPNVYEPGRANLTVVNWDRAATIDVDLAPANLAVGSRYEIRDAQNFYGPPVLTGTYLGAPIALTMAGLTAASPIGNVPIVPAHTAPELAVFVVLPLGAAPPPPATPLRLDALVPAVGAAGGGFNVTLQGAGFDPATAVLFDGVPASGMVVNSATSLTVTAPSHVPGAVDVEARKGAERATRTAAFTYTPVAPLMRPLSVSGNHLGVEWSGGGSTPVRGYYLVGGLTPGGSQFGPFAMGLATRTAALVGPGRYYARVVADTDWGPLTSNEVSATVGLPVQPSAPTLGPAQVNGRTVSLSWSAVGGASSYVVVARSSAAGPVVATLPVAGTALVVAAPPGVFHVSVVAANASGVGPESNQIVVSVA
ncbi:MAG: IPT/TIG domain-containing protein [Vicinamibacterales bacterium]